MTGPVKPIPILGNLTEEQRAAADRLQKSTRFILNLQTGFGKTRVTLTALADVMNKYPFVYGIAVIPIAAIKIFLKELRESVPIPFYINTTQVKKSDPNPRLFIYTYQTLEKHVKDIQQLHSKKYKLALIMDEVHELRTGDTTAFSVIKEQRDKFSAAWGMTATPLLSDIHGLYNVVNTIAPKYLGTKKAFRETFLIEKKLYIRGRKWTPRNQLTEIVGYKNLELLKKLLDDISLIKRRDYDLRFYFRSDDPLEDEMAAYVQAAHDIVSEKKWGAGLHTLQRTIDNGCEPFIKDDLTVKEKLLINTVQSVLARDECTLIYVSYYSTLDRLKEIFTRYRDLLRLGNIYTISGKDTKLSRRVVEDKISPRDIALITDAASVSYNLGRCNNIIFYNLPFIIGGFIQIVGRITRMDSIHDWQNVFVIEARNTIDTYKKLLIQENIKLIRSLFGNETHLPGQFIPDIIDRAFIKNCRKKLLWKLRSGKKRK